MSARGFASKAIGGGAETKFRWKPAAVATGPIAPRCYVCGTAEVAADADLRNPTCEAHKVARDHLVSMQTGAGGSAVAVCQCGWRSESRGRGRMITLDVKVRMHWHTMIRAAATATATATATEGVS